MNKNKKRFVTNISIEWLAIDGGTESEAQIVCETFVKGGLAVLSPNRKAKLIGASTAIHSVVNHMEAFDE